MISLGHFLKLVVSQVVDVVIFHCFVRAYITQRYGEINLSLHLQNYLHSSFQHSSTFMNKNDIVEDSMHANQLEGDANNAQHVPCEVMEQHCDTDIESVSGSSIEIMQFCDYDNSDEDNDPTSESCNQ